MIEILIWNIWQLGSSLSFTSMAQNPTKTGKRRILESYLVDVFEASISYNWPKSRQMGLDFVYYLVVGRASQRPYNL